MAPKFVVVEGLMLDAVIDEQARCNDWREVDAALRSIARRRAALDVEEARWLRDAERLQIWRPLGMVSALDYLERVLGYTPHAANERLRVARALGDLPQLESAFAQGELGFSALRELTRVATPETQDAWRDAAAGKNVREIEDLVAGHQRGDHPDDPADPSARRYPVRFDLSADVFARLRQVQAALADEHGGRLDDDRLFTALCDAVLDATTGGESSGRAKFQIAVTVCDHCKQGWQEGAGAKIAIDAAALERAHCDAQHMGDLDAAVPTRATQDIPPSVARLVWRRDGGRCQTPGCRSARGLEIHHIVRRADGGTHDPSNLRIQCSACHLALHRGTLEISGSRGELVVSRPNGPTSHVGPNPHQSSHVESNRTHDACVESSLPNGSSTELGTMSTSNASRTTLDTAITRTQARDALVGLGWKPHIARAAVDEAIAVCGSKTSLEVLIRESLRRCPVTRSG
jgi:hypothetical protein